MKADKCEANHLGKNRPENIVIKDQGLDYKPTTDYLGLQVDPQLSFKDHISQVVRKPNKFCGFDLSSVTFISEKAPTWNFIFRLRNQY